MKRIFTSLMAVVFVAAATAAFAHPALDRAGTGFKDIITSPLEVRDHVKTEMTTAQFVPFGLIGGALKGTFYMGKKIVDGTWTVVSTPYHMVTDKDAS